MAKETKEKEKVKIVHFKLGDRQAIWKTPNGEINLSIFPGKDGKANNTGKISTDDENYQHVRLAFRSGNLMKVSEKNATPEKVSVTNITDIRDNDVRVDMMAKQFLDMRAEQLVMTIGDIKEPHIVSRMIEMESKSQNKYKRRRVEVINSLKERLSEMKGSVIKDYVEHGEEISVKVSSDGVGKADKTLDEATE